jgi:beta-glucosidase-like glycosyl hydrolase
MKTKLLLGLCATMPFAHADFERAYAQLSLSQKIGQLLFIGYRDPAQLKDLQAGGVALFSWNMKSSADARRLTAEIRRTQEQENLWPLLIATDHEGGRVLRLRQGITPFPDALALGATGDEKLSFEVGRRKALELKSLGINTNFAPVLDLGNARSFLQNRVWGSDPVKVSKMTVAYMKGLKEGGVLSVSKHFPGHGSSIVDAHFGRPIIKKSWETIWAYDLLPFRRIIAAGAPAMMTAHAEIQSVERGPASSSRKLLSTVLRKILHYDGLVVSDDLEMQAARGLEHSHSLGDLALQSLKAGSDMLMIVWSKREQQEVQKRLTLAVLQGELLESEIKERLRRIWDVKSSYASSQLREVAARKAEPPSADSLRLVQDILKRAIHWEAGNREKVFKVLKQNEATPWHLWMPDERAKRAWLARRAHDQIEILPKFMTSAQRAKIIASIAARMRSGKATIVVTPPRARGDELFFQQLLTTMNKLQAHSARVLPVVWMHQGSAPIQIPSRLQKELKMGILSLASSSPYSVQLFTQFFREKASTIE